MWNEAIKIIKCVNTPDHIKELGKMILRQYNTAAGSIYLKKDLQWFVEDNEWYLLLN